MRYSISLTKRGRRPRVSSVIALFICDFVYTPLQHMSGLIVRGSACLFSDITNSGWHFCETIAIGSDCGLGKHTSAVRKQCQDGVPI